MASEKEVMEKQTETSTGAKPKKAPRFVGTIDKIPPGSKVTSIAIGDSVTWRAGETLTQEERRKRVVEALNKQEDQKQSAAAAQLPNTTPAPSSNEK
jgi:hypothetical protein